MKVQILTTTLLTALLVTVMAAGMAQGQEVSNRTGPLPIRSQAPLAGVPIGAILPFIGPLDTLPDTWLPCDGRTVDDPSSPIHGLELPDLTDGRFLMGVGAAGMIGVSGGSNAIPTAGGHTHSGEATGRITQTSGSPRNLEQRGDKGFRHSHALTVSSSGGHDHGGDNRPAFYGVHYIVRVK
jgi:hypothetical protein